MLRTARPLLNPIINPASAAQRLAFPSRASYARTAALASLSLAQHKPISRKPAPLILSTCYSSKPLQPNKPDSEAEKEIGKKIIEARPDEVSAESSVRHVFEESAAPKTSDGDVTRGVKNDLNTIKETLALNNVPREPYALGLAGTLPYLATSISTVYLAWDLNTAWPTTSNFLNSILVSHETAAHWLHLLEPIQVGYGAVIISFLGAVHWGLEYAEKTPSRDRTRFRYGIGVIAPAIAWPTIFMPIHWALTTQFLSFTFLYFADARATTKGWTPSWYGTYRFVLTAVVGAAIFISLVGRAKVGESRSHLTSTELQNLLQQKADGSEPYRNWAKEEEEERVRLRKEKEAEEKKKKEEEKKKAEEKKKKGGKDDAKDGSKENEKDKQAGEKESKKEK
ncbi:hypothetical protein B0T25DRAFT_280170 [Lasiosphaeria hispida]|uniref:Mitochondrial inner membrane protein 1 n=1 Tax=Lasiosphaeria hispida TaxID=260671 RepID=A0AAJ0HC70_9PEZI|nr:hypothetical protein B0T25DRAFT_280170 [Lasiosphaeria hispida]